MLRERLLASTLGFVGLVAVSVVAQNPGDPANRTQKLSRQLKLTADQQSQMLDTLESTKSQLEAVWSDRSLSRKVRNRKLALIRQASNAQICAFLEKEQNAKLVRIRNSYAYHDSSPPNWFSR